MALPTVKIKFEVDPAAAKRGLADIQTALKATDAATKKYEKDLIGLKRAQDTGLLSLKKYDAELKKLNTDYLKTSQAAAKLAGATAKVESPTKKTTGAFARLANVSNRTRFQLQNVAFQLQDIIVQIQGGQGVTRALSQQLPQLAGGFGVVGAAVGVLAGLGVPALAFAFTALRGKVVDTDDALESLAEATEELRASNALAAPALEASKAYDVLLEKIRESNEAARDLATGELLTSLGLAADQLADFDIEQRLGTGFTGAGGAQAADELNVKSLEQAVFLRQRIVDIAKAEGVEQARLLSGLEETLELRGIQVTGLDELIVKLADQLGVEKILSKVFTEQLKDKEKSKVANQKILESIEDILGSTQGLQKAEKALQKVQNDRFLAQIDALAAVDAQLGLNEEKLIRLPQEIKEAAIKMLEFQLATADAGFQTQLLLEKIQAIRDTMAGVSTGVPLFLAGLTGGELIPSEEEFTGKKPTKAGAAKVDPAEAKLERLIESLQTEQETIELFREEGLALLATASETELAALGGINEAKLRLEEEYQERLRGIKVTADRSNLGMTLSAGTQLLGALGQFNDKALKLSKVFGIAEALVSTYKGAAKALELPFPANLFAMATVIATGLSQVAAIRGVSKGGGGGGGASGAAVSAPAVAAAAPAAAPAAAAQTPLNVRLSGLGINDLISGGQLSALFDSLQDEAGDRGLNVSFAT